MNNRSNQVIEFASFTLAEGVDESTLVAASDALQSEFLNRQKGFIRRDLARLGDGKWADVAYWENRESVEQAMQNAPTSPAALQYFQLMVNNGQDDPSAGMLLLDVAKSYS